MSKSAPEIQGMNKKMLAQSVGQTRKVRPLVIQAVIEPGVPVRFRRRRHLDDPWFVMSYVNDELRLSNQRTGHVLSLPTDHIREYRRNPAGPGFLILKSQVFMEGVSVSLEPLV